MNEDTSKVGLFLFGDVPAERQQEKKQPGFLDRHFGAVLTLIGVVATATLAAFSNLFGVSGSNEVPTASIVFAERFQPVGGAPGKARIPVNTVIRLFAGDSSDPDSDLSRLTHSWIDSPGKARTTCNASESACRYHDFLPDAPGDYMVSLVVSDANDFEDNCPLIHRWNNRLGCRKDAIATVQIEVLPDMKPAITTTQDHTEVTRGDSLFVDAGLSTSFDGALPFLSWSIDERLVARGRSKLVVPTDTFPDEKSEFRLSISALDRLGGMSAQTFTIKILAPHKIVLPGLAPSDATSADREPISPQSQQGSTMSFALMCRGGSEISLSGPINVSQGDQPCSLPTRVVSNGHPISILSNNLISNNTEIVAFNSPASAGKQGAIGLDGSSGDGSGGDGNPGGSGAPGTEGADGQSAAPIFIKARMLNGDLKIFNNGQAGGDGGAGGHGGNGGSGASGSPSRTGILDCRSGPGRGGDGGAGGRGGNGGHGGAGGAAGRVLVEIETIANGSILEISALGGLPGDPGLGGPPGRGGRGGAEGPTSGLCGSAGRTGHPGATGIPGISGIFPSRLPTALVTVNGVVQDLSSQKNGSVRIYSESL